MKNKIVAMLFGMCLGLGAIVPAQAQFAQSHNVYGYTVWGDWHLIVNSPWTYHTFFNWGHRTAIPVPTNGFQFGVISMQIMQERLENIMSMGKNGDYWRYRGPDIVRGPDVGETIWLEYPQASYQDKHVQITIPNMSGYARCEIRRANSAQTLAWASNNASTCEAGADVVFWKQGWNGSGTWDKWKSYNPFVIRRCVNTSCTGTVDKSWVKAVVSDYHTPGVLVVPDVYSFATPTNGVCPAGFGHAESDNDHICIKTVSARNSDDVVSDEDEAIGASLWLRWVWATNSGGNIPIDPIHHEQMDPMNAPQPGDIGMGPPYRTQEQLCAGEADPNIWDEIPGNSSQENVCKWGVYTSYAAFYSGYTCETIPIGNGAGGAMRHAMWTAYTAWVLEHEEGFPRADAIETAKKWTYNAEGPVFVCEDIVDNGVISGNQSADCANDLMGANVYAANAGSYSTTNRGAAWTAIRQDIEEAIKNGSNATYETSGWVEPGRSRTCDLISLPESLPGSDW